MSAFRFYLSVPQNGNTYSDFFEITDDVLENSVGNIKQYLSSNEYDIGTIKFNKITVNLRNEKSSYSEASNPLSVFPFKRDETILKIEWDINEGGISCGSFACGHTFLSHPVEVFKGILEDNSSKFDVNSQVQSFNFLGLESIIGKTSVPFGSLSVSDDVETTIYNLLNQDKITRFLTVDSGNISVNENFTPDDISSLNNKKVLEALDEILFLSGAVLFVKDDAIIVQPRDASVDSKYTFYGPSSDLGIESIHDVSNKTLGLNRTFNFWSWAGTSVTQSFADSIDLHGYRPKEIESELVTDTGKITSILNKLLLEFGFPKIELDLVVPIKTEILTDIFLLDKINIDYPADYRGDGSDALPARYGTARYGESQYIRAISSLIISIATNWKILNRVVQTQSDKITFKIREV